MRKTWKIGALAVLLTLGALVAMVAMAQDEEPGTRIWEHMSERFDENQDGAISREEFDRATSRFPRLDQNEDGVLTAEDFATIVERGKEARGERKAGGMLIRMADANRDHELTLEEWNTFLTAVDTDLDGLVSVEELRATRPERAGRRLGPQAQEGEGRGERVFGELFDENGDGLVEVSEISGVFADLDTNQDGVISGEELPRHGGPKGSRGRHGRGRFGGGFGGGSTGPGAGGQS